MRDKTGTGGGIIRERLKALRELEVRLGYRFKEPALLDAALTHSSYAHEVLQGKDAPSLWRGKRPRGKQHNESMEFLGDALLGFVVSDHLYQSYPDWSEGRLSQVKAVLVSKSTLVRCARTIGIGKYLLLGKGESESGGAERPSMLADALEAVVAAVYLDGGLEACSGFLLRQLGGELKRIERDEHEKDYKSVLQELTQSRFGVLPEYRVGKVQGPDHRPVYDVYVSVRRRELGHGRGPTKKEAERRAAEEALRAMGAGRNLWITS